jgi:Tol biopolymer transport system component
MAELLTDLREIKLQPELMPQVARITGNKKRRSKGFLILLVGLMSSLLLVGGYRLYRYRELRGQTATVVHPSQMTVRRFTTYGGLPLRAAISSDGRSLAYIQRLNNKNSLWLGDVDTNNSSPLYQQADLEVIEPTFAPDGNSIYFITAGEQHPNGMLKRMSVSGGDVIDLIPNVQSPVALSTDGRHIAMLLRNSELKQTSIVTCDAADGRNQQTLVTRTWPDDFTIDSLTWSPDGQRIAFSVHREGARDEILSVKLADRSIRRIGSRNWATVDGLLWLSDGSLIAVATENVGERRREIWIVSTTGEPRQITDDQNIFLLPQLSVSANGRLTVMHGHITSEIWIAPDGEAQHARRVLQGVVPRYEGVDGLTWTPDQRLLYTAYVGNSLVIWSMDRDGNNLKQLTQGKPNTSDSYVSATADGRFLIFQSNRSGELEIWRANVDGGDLRQLTHGGNNQQPSLSPGGQWVIYASVRDGKSTLWRVSIDGSDQKQLTDNPSKWPQVSPDGKYIAYVEAVEAKRSRMAIMSFEGGEPMKMFAVADGGLVGRLVFRWTPDSKGIMYKVAPKGLWRQDLESETATPVRGFEDAILQNLAWSLDGKNLAYTVGPGTQEIMLIENFKSSRL